MITSNVVILGLIAAALVWLFKRVGWAPDGVPSLWVTMGVALILGAVEAMLSGAFAVLPTCALQDPGVGLLCGLDVVQKIVENAGVVFVAATTIYKLLRVTIDRTGKIL